MHRHAISRSSYLSSLINIDDSASKTDIPGQALHHKIDEWVKQQPPGSTEHSNIAAQRIKDAYAKKDVNVNLSDLSLTSLPANIERLFNIEAPIIEKNNATQFPLVKNVPQYANLKEVAIQGGKNGYFFTDYAWGVKNARFTYAKNGNFIVFFNCQLKKDVGNMNLECNDKLHISVRKEDLHKAFDVCAPLLLSKNAPMLSWKVTDITVPPVDSSGKNIDIEYQGFQRISSGAQFTLYFKSDCSTSERYIAADKAIYLEDRAKAINDFARAIEETLSENNIQPGQQPDSDIAIKIAAKESLYLSYRSEYLTGKYGNGTANEALRAKLSQQHFFKIFDSNYVQRDFLGVLNRV